MGSEKYPEENYYAQLIQDNGGTRNGATGEDYSYYFFDIGDEAFPKAVDILSHFFKDPLLTESATFREMNAVDSEHRKNLSDDNWRIYQFEKSVIAIPGSRLDKFGTGSL